MTTISFIGTGHITSAIVAGLCGLPAAPVRILVGPRNAAIAADLARRYAQVTVAADNQNAVDEGDWVVLAVRPQIARAVVSGLKFKPGQRVLSLIAPVGDDWLDAAVAPARLAARFFAMPSVEARIGPVMILPYDAEVATLLQPLGRLVPARDRREFLALWSVTALIAPYYGFLAGSADWAAANGAQARTAAAFAAASFHALGAMADRPDAPSPTELAQHAQTPGGLNEQVMRQLAAGNWFGAVGASLDGILKRLEGKA
jgi:pyrroline-5-carboxylate reductase